MCRSIFIIDDYPINLRIAEMIIRNQGVFEKVSTYLDASEAFEHLTTHMNNEAHLPDVILLDIHMPLMDGWMFLDRFEDIMPYFAKRIEIFIASSSMDYYDRQRIKRYPSVKGAFQKPLQSEMLHEIAARLGAVG